MIASSPAASRSTGFYAPELDGLRWFAVLGVMIAHFSWTWKSYFDWGGPAVRLFFVLSGFLITLLLLRARAKCELGPETAGSALRRFWIRRIFRLWPLYFASLGLAYALHLSGTEAPIAWHVFFATNQYVFNHQHWLGLLSHFWTLAVEQQFYFIWPLVVLWCPYPGLKRVLVIMVIAGPVSRWLPIFLGWVAPEYAGLLLPGCLDYFAFGAIVALLSDRGGLEQLGSQARLRSGILLTLGWLLTGALLKPLGIQPYYFVVYDGTLQAAGFALLLVYLLRFRETPLAAFLRWRPFVFLGQISYGIYILHNFTHRFGPSVTRRITGQNYLTSETANVITYVAFSVGAAVLTYFLFEEPLRKLGQRLAAPRLSPKP